MSKVQILADMREEGLSTSVLGLDDVSTATEAMELDFMDKCGYSEDEAIKAAQSVREFDNMY